MDFKDLIKMSLDEYLDELRKAIDGLSADERRFMPSPESHHIDWTVWHMARVEDDWIQRFSQQLDTVWQSGGWFERMGLPERTSGFGFTAEEVTGLPSFDIDEMMAYYDAVRAETLKFLDGQTASDLEVCPHPRRPEYSFAMMWSHLIIEESQHVGQVAYIRGIKRGLGK